LGAAAGGLLGHKLGHHGALGAIGGALAANLLGKDKKKHRDDKYGDEGIAYGDDASSHHSGHHSSHHGHHHHSSHHGSHSGSSYGGSSYGPSSAALAADSAYGGHGHHRHHRSRSRGHEDSDED
jgi:hypothetical protein